MTSRKTPPSQNLIPSDTQSTMALPPKIFDKALLKQRRARANLRKGNFFIQRCAQDLADRLLDINREFSDAAYWGPDSAVKVLSEILPVEKRPKHFLSNKAFHEIPENSLNLVVSLLQMQSENDPVGTLIQMRKRLKADGLLIVAMFGGDTLSELRNAFYAADTNGLGGVSPRVFPFADHVQAAQLLSRAGLALPVVDVDRFCVHYKAFSTLISDLRDLGETNVLNSRNKTYIGKPFLEHLTQAYEKSEGEKFKTRFEILWMTGWAPDDSQQKPSKRGSANISLGDALKQINQQTNHP